jgi:hypothetical protein
MSIAPILVAFLIPVAIADAKPAVVTDIHIQMPDTHQPVAAAGPILLSMGPDPGGKTGATVNSDTTKTGQSPTSGASNAGGGTERGSTQSQGTTTGSDNAKRGSNTGNAPKDSTDHSLNGPATLSPPAASR